MAPTSTVREELTITIARRELGLLLQISPDCGCGCEES